MRVAGRLEHFKGYLGTEMNVRLTRMREEGRDVINLGLGDPDITPPPHLLKALREAVKQRFLEASIGAMRRGPCLDSGRPPGTIPVPCR